MFEQLTDTWDKDTARHSLDELFLLARRYRSGKEYRELLQFTSRFRFYSLFNAVLLHVQMPGAVYVATAYRWKRDYKRRVRLEARPLVILKPMGPVMFVFDVSDTEPELGAPPLPIGVTEPFAVRRGFIHDELERTIENAKRDGIKVAHHDAGALHAGNIQRLEAGQFIQYQVRRKTNTESISVPLRYGILLNENQSAETQYATLAHELAHLYCGHLGSPNQKWWPDSHDRPNHIRELEAESVSFLVCARLGIKNPSEEYLSSHVRDDDELSTISLDRIMRAATLIEHMGKERLSPRRADISVVSRVLDELER